MDTKLTLKIDQSIISRAKKYAKENDISLSKLIESYLKALTDKTKKETAVSPLVESLSGVISLSDAELKKEYTDFLSEKYK